MKTYQINTTQNVNIKFAVANFGERLLAFGIDNVLKFAYLYVIFTVFDFQMIENDGFTDYWSVKAINVILILPVTFYSLYSEILMGGQTLGKRVLKIKVITIDGFKPSIIDHSMRWFLRIVDFNFFTLLFVYLSMVNLDRYIGLIMLAFLFGKSFGSICIMATKNSQRLGDIAANTIVISLKDSVKFSDTISEEIVDSYKPTYPSVIKLSDNDARIIKDTYKVALKTSDHKTLMKLKIKIEEVTGIQSKENSASTFLDTVLKDYNFYTQDM